MKRRLVAGIGLLLLLSSFMTVGAAPLGGPSTTQVTAAERLLQNEIIKGQGVLPTGKPDLALAQNLTRAELATILVRALGVEWRLATTMRPAPYADVPVTAWYTPHLHLLKQVAAEKGLNLGTPEGNFEPTRPVSRVEAIVLTLKLMGQRPEGTASPWYEPWLALASRLGVLTKLEANSISQSPTEAITRGEAFLYLDRMLDLPLSREGALYDTVLDRVAPVVVMNAEPPVDTVQTSFVLAGTATDNRGVALITANGVRLVSSETGWFMSEPIPLKLGLNELELKVEDRNGNSIIKTWQVMRNCCFAARTEHALYPQYPRTLQPGERVQINLKVYDENGKLLPPAPYRVVTEMGTVADGWFTARTQAGKGGVEIWTMNLQEAFNIEILPGAAAGLMVPTVKAGVQTYLQAADKWSNPIMGGTWRARSAGISITEAGLFQAEVPGRYYVAFYDRGAETMLAVDVTP